jgi:DNA (cytosine-5)-methyltransferase 1
VNIIPIRGDAEWTALEFFAGIGLARAGMEQAGIKTVWSNDYDLNKKSMYEGHWKTHKLFLADIHTLNSEDLPTADVAWASSPCTDLSLAVSVSACGEAGNRPPSSVLLICLQG